MCVYIYTCIILIWKDLKNNNDLMVKSCPVFLKDERERDVFNTIALS